MLRSIAITLFAGSILATCPGCQEEAKVSNYTVDQPDRQQLRLLVGILPYRDKTWFFRLSGPGEAVAAQQKNFQSFIDSLKIDDDKNPPIAWAAPKGWQEQPGKSSMRFATFLIEGDPDLELTVVPLGHDPGTQLQNINRWRGQLTLPPVEEPELKKLMKHQEVSGHDVAMVDMTGIGNYAAPQRAHPTLPPGFEMPPPGVGAGQPQEEPKLPFTYNTPDGWKVQNPPAPLSVVSFKIGNDTAVTVTPLPQQAGGVVPNVMRWRRQVGLPPISEKEVLATVMKLKVLGDTASYVDIDNPPGPAGRNRILGAILSRPDRTWFFKMTGSSEVVAKHKQEFETFLKSLKLDSK